MRHRLRALPEQLSGLLLIIKTRLEGTLSGIKNGRNSAENDLDVGTIPQAAENKVVVLAIVTGNGQDSQNEVPFGARKIVAFQKP